MHGRSLLLRGAVVTATAGLGLILLAGSGPPEASAGVPAGAGVAKVPGPALADTGYAITNEAVLRGCVGCHRLDENGRMGRVSFMRKTPEGWQRSIRRMASLHGMNLDPETAREVVRYLATHQGIAPEELEEGRFEVERRMVSHLYEDRDIQSTCAACHSMGRIITQRRTGEEWKLLIETHRGLYPLVDRQTFRNFSPPSSGDRRHPVEKAVDHFTAAYPLETPEWSAWAANLRAPRLDGSWALEGHDPARGPLFGTMTVRPVPGREDEFTHETTWVHPEDGTTVRRTGRTVVYTGYQWRGRSSAAGGSGPDLREVLSVERGWDRMSGRWFTGDHDELGVDVTLRRVTPAPLVSGVYPPSVRTGATGQELRVFGANLPGSVSAGDVDFGAGVTVRSVSRTSAGVLVVRVDVSADASPGMRDLRLPGAARTGALAVYDRIHAVRVNPDREMARIGGEVHPKRYAQFEAIAYHNGPDGRAGTDDDLPLGRVPVEWSIEEFPHTLEDDDRAFVGTIDARGFFTPGADGVPGDRSGDRNNIGNVWVVATHRPEAPSGAGNASPASPLRGRGHLLVSVPIYLYWDAWPERPLPEPEPRRPVGDVDGNGGVGWGAAPVNPADNGSPEALP